MNDAAQQPVAPVREGDIVAGKYRVERVLGMGGMGVVVAAIHVELDQRVALKFLLPHAASNPDVATRFGREARSAAKIRSEHVARVLDVGTLPDGSPYMVMEYMDGQDLEKVLRAYGPMQPEVAAGHVLEACEAIAEAHSLGIVHRDLKPANLFLAARPSGAPSVKVLDFGISKSTLGTSQAQLTKTSSLMGSPLYMSPEQLTSAKTVDIRSDVWALGIVLYELLVGHTPFPAETMPELVAAILQRPLDPIRAFRNDVPAGLDAAVQRCLEKDPSRRFANVAELAAAIAPYGPARSDVSVERIAHVLGLAAPSGVAALQASSGSSLGPGAGVAGSMTNSPWSRSTGAVPGATIGSRLGLLAAGGALFGILLVAGVGFVLTHAKGDVHVDLQSPAASASNARSAPSAPNAADSSSAAAASPATAPEPPSTGSTRRNPPESAPIVATTVSAPRPAAHPASTPTPAPAPAPAASSKCHLVSYPDSEGNMRFKQECAK